MSKPKLALCVSASSLPPRWQEATEACTVPIPDSFWQTPTLLIDRALCETDSTLQQLLPYIVLVDEKNRMFTYSRGKGGGEARLHAKLSIGVGGHVDGYPPPGTNLRDWLQQEAQREIAEETTVVVPLEDIRFDAFLVDRADDVGSVHLGLLAIVKVRSEDVKGVEAEAIEEGGFVDITEVMKRRHRLENWSRLALDFNAL